MPRPVGSATGRHMGTEAAGEICPATVEHAIRQANAILVEAGVAIGPSRLARVARDWFRLNPNMPFRTYVVQSCHATCGDPTPAPPARHNVEWVDTTGDTVAHEADRGRSSLGSSADRAGRSGVAQHG